MIPKTLISLWSKQLFDTFIHFEVIQSKVYSLVIHTTPYIPASCREIIMRNRAFSAQKTKTNLAEVSVAASRPPVVRKALWAWSVVEVDAGLWWFVLRGLAGRSSSRRSSRSRRTHS